MELKLNGASLTVVHVSRPTHGTSMPKRPAVACAVAIGAACGYVALGAAGMPLADRVLFVGTDGALMLVVSELIRERD